MSNNSTSTRSTIQTNATAVSSKSIQSLIKPDYDTKIIKNGWLNAVPASSSNDINEQSLKLYRVELKGSNLYVYKPPNQLNVRSFKHSSNDDTNNKDDFLQPPATQLMLNQNLNNSNSSLSSNEIYKSINNNDSNISLTETGSPVINQYQPHEPQPIDDSATDFSITYFNTQIPHPNLNYDFHIHQFSSSIVSINQSKSITINSIESIFHFILFTPVDANNELSIDSIISILPILPHFGKILKFLSTYLSAIFANKFQGSYNLNVIVERTLRILYNIEENFDGFLLKSTIAPYILNVVEILTTQVKQHSSTSSVQSENIYKFKRTMLSKQQLLINLVNNKSDSNNYHHENSSDIDPFQDLSSSVFMKDINLLDFVKIVSSIDLKFFNNWNSNIDKSLLLYSSINNHDDNNNSNGGNNGVNPSDFYKKNPLIFNNDHHIHYLSRLLINHLFIENSSSSSSTTLEKKARLLEKWIDLGCLLDKSGNMSSWLGISSIILSQPVLRLTKIWSLVSPEYIKLLKNDWSPVLFELDRRHLANNAVSTMHNNNNNNHDSQSRESSMNFKDSYHIMAPRGLGKIYPKEKVIPYFGDLVINNQSSTNMIDIFDLESIWKRINYSFNRWNEYLSNLVNYNEIIKYNEDVLRRYDNMGFIFSNESLNQVLYLGVNNDDNVIAANGGNKTVIPNDLDDIEQPMTMDSKYTSNELKSKLMKLIEINCESINLDKIMKLSINLEPGLPEGYLKLPTTTSVIPSTPLELSFIRNRNNGSGSHSSNNNGLAIHVNNSSNSLDTGSTAVNDSISTNTIPTSSSEFNPNLRLPTFNNEYFRINLAKYDELTAYFNNDDKSHLQHLLDPTINKHNLVIDSELTFRIDDFIVDQSDSVNNTTMSTTLDDIDNVDFEDDIPGLGIDVDDILNSEKFNNFTMSPKTVPSKKFNSIISTESGGSNKNRLSNSPSERIHKFIPKYATVDRLVDLCLIDSRYFNEDIILDLTEYRFVFLLNYTSFISTKDLLDKLAHRFINSGNAVISVMKKEYYTRQKGKEATAQYLAHAKFPNWSLDNSVDLNELGQVDYELLLKIQINILKALIVLINNFYSYFSLDLTNKRILIKLLKLFSNEILQWYNSNKIDNNLAKSFESLVSYYKKLKKLFVKKTYRPIEISKFDEYLIKEFRFNNSLQEVPMNRNLPSHKNVLKIEKFLHKFNKLLTVFYKGIKAEDWIRVYRILENSFEVNCLLEFNLQKSTTSDETIIISNIFNYFETLIDPNERQLILKKFPLVFRKLFKLYFKFRTYLLIQLTDLNINVEERLDRMKTLLIMCQISKLKMGENQFVFEGAGEGGNIPSCIETAITNVIYSPESRMFNNLWMKASNSLTDSNHSYSHFDDLDSLLPKHLTMADLQNPEPLLPCFGWIIENLIETNKCPSFFKNCVNFNKRYLTFKLIREFGIEDLDGSSDLSNTTSNNNGTQTDFNHYDSKDFEFLLKLNESLVKANNIKDFTISQRESGKVIFKSIIAQQHKILQLDNKKKQLKEGAKPVVNPNHTVTLNKKTSSSSLRRQSLNYKSNSASRFKISGLFNKTRPFSLNGMNGPERVVDVSELPDADTFIDPKQKAYLIIPLKNRKIFPVYLLPLCFKVDSDSTTNSQDDFLLQAPNDSDLNDWLVKLNYANRHWFFSKSLTNVKTNSANIVFGVPISIVCHREQTTCPRFLTAIFNEIETDGIKDIGVYRISSSVSELSNIKSIIDKTGTIDFNDRGYDIHALTSIVKSYFRELPDAILTDKVIESFFNLKQQQQSQQQPQQEQTASDQAKLINKYRDILNLLPPVNYATVKALIQHLNKISQYSDSNKMTASNLATVIGPALTEASSLEALVNNFGFMNSILDKLIANCDAIY
ncbi:hypothetical protein DFJ63DRAFT_289371 [Scheffersomyces coipomensis]|uniref:uncharacterized protein n=1 Tax=Scheffersomyces coipomensis TaxID=1788519 RepID=UPI00315C71EC